MSTEEFNPARPTAEDMVPENSAYSLPESDGTVTVTPEMASDWLSYRNHPRNRPLSKHTVSKYQRVMESDKWRENTPEGLIFDTDGRIISGQHRLAAQANSGKTLAWRVFVDEPREIFEFVDQGYKRTASHLLRVPHGTTVGAGARLLVALADNDPYALPRYSRITTPEVVEMAHEWPELTWYSREIFAAYLNSGIPAGPHSAVLAQAARTAARDKIAPWLEEIANGVNLTSTDPAWHLRRRFQVRGVTVKKGSSGLVSVYGYIAKAWNAYAAGDEMNVLRLAYNDPIPEIFGHPRTLIAHPEAKTEEN